MTRDLGDNRTTSSGAKFDVTAHRRFMNLWSKSGRGDRGERLGSRTTETVLHPEGINRGSIDLSPEPVVDD